MKNEKSGSRLKEITAVLRKHELTRGITPEKLRLILEDLGPTFIKIGQIMSLHSDVLPKKYCDELMKLRSDVAPMPFSEVEEVIEDSYGYPWQEVFSQIEKETLGSASIAQVHRATLKTGEEVVVKVQRKGIYDTMARDIGLLHKAVKLVPPISIKETIDFSMVLDELWVVTQEEMNFLTEAANMEEFARRNKDIAYVRTPVLYKEFTTHHVLVMEYIEGYPIDEKEVLEKEGYDLEEIGTKLVDHYIKQVMDDGFFHADPHPGNVHISDGKIVWIDMGMMGRLSDRDRELISDAIQGIAINDIGMIQDAVLALGEFRGKPDQSKLYEDISSLMIKYGKLDMGNIDVAEAMQDLMEVMKTNRISMPHGLTMLARGLTQMEAMAKGALPIAMSTGGLVDTIEDGVDGFRTEVFFTEKRRVFGSNLTAKRLKTNENAYTETLYKALAIYYSKPSQINNMKKKAMEKDFSWNAEDGSIYKYHRLLKTGHL